MSCVAKPARHGLHMRSPEDGSTSVYWPGRHWPSIADSTQPWIVMAYIVMAWIVMPYIVIAYIVMA